MFVCVCADVANYLSSFLIHAFIEINTIWICVTFIIRLSFIPANESTGDKMFKAKSYKPAIQYYSRAIGKCSAALWQILFKRAKCHFANNSLSDALADCNKITDTLQTNHKYDNFQCNVLSISLDWCIQHGEATTAMEIAEKLQQSADSNWLAENQAKLTEQMDFIKKLVALEKSLDNTIDRCDTCKLRY